MIKLVVFDLDGVLVSTKEIHFHAFNDALENVWGKGRSISFEEHLKQYDGISTKKKLEKLTELYGLPEFLYNQIWLEKQKQTKKYIESLLNPSHYLDKVELLGKLKEDGYTVFCASNCIRESMTLMLESLGCMPYIDKYISNEEVYNIKPHSEIYLRCMVSAGVNPKETLIVEDSVVGRESANKSGAHVLAVNCPSEVTIDRVYGAIDKAEGKAAVSNRWDGGDMNILIPMSGKGSRFAQAGYTFPKPLITVNGKAMIQVVVENLNINGNYIFVVDEGQYNKYNLEAFLNVIAPNCKIIVEGEERKGAAWSTLLATEYINNDRPLVIANSDQFVEWDSSEFMYELVNRNVDGSILTFSPECHPKWSYAKVDNGFVSEVAEKNPISNEATVGVYGWKRGSDYVKYANQMIKKDIKVNGEYYVCPVFNEAISDNKRFITHNIEKSKMWGLGTPEDLNTFLESHHGQV